MPDTSTIENGLHTLVDQVNHFYWQSGQTVDEIAARLGVSRSTIYSSIEPWSAGALCRDCGQPLWFANRSNRSAGIASCEACDKQFSLSADAGGRNGMGVEDGSTWSRWRQDLAEVAPERVMLIGGAAALGVVTGALAVRAYRGMR